MHSGIQIDCVYGAFTPVLLKNGWLMFVVSLVPKLDSVGHVHFWMTQHAVYALRSARFVGSGHPLFSCYVSM